MATDRDAWPEDFPLTGEGRVAPGLVVWSLPVKVEGHDGPVEGRTTGGRQACKTLTCGGWLLGVRWESGDRASICSRGWAYDARNGSISITGGTGLSTTTATDRPHSRKEVPDPRSTWPNRGDLGPAWRTRVADGTPQPSP